MKIYLAGPLFNRIERDRNRQLTDILRNADFKVHLPQESGIAANTDGTKSESKVRHELVMEDIRAIDNADVIVACVDGVVTDPGTCWELGYACARGKSVVLFYDFENRNFMNGHLNAMLEETTSIKCNTMQEVLDACRRLRD